MKKPKLKNVVCVDASSLTDDKQVEYGIKEGLVAIETYDDKCKLKYKVKEIRFGIVDYILYG